MLTTLARQFLRIHRLTEMDIIPKNLTKFLKIIFENYENEDAFEIWEQFLLILERSEANNAENKFIMKNSKYKPKQSFDEIFSEFSTGTQMELIQKNFNSEKLFIKIKYTEISKINLTARDKLVFKTLTMHCQNANFTQGDNPIIERFPINSIVTKKVMKRNDISLFKLYFLTSLEEIRNLFAKYPSIPSYDKQNILAGIALARCVMQKF